MYFLLNAMDEHFRYEGGGERVFYSNNLHLTTPLYMMQEKTYLVFERAQSTDFGVIRKKTVKVYLPKRQSF